MKGSVPNREESEAEGWGRTESEPQDARSKHV